MIEWGTTLSGKCESCVFGETRLAMNCPNLREVFYKYFREIDDIWISKCMNHRKEVSTEVLDLVTTPAEDVIESESVFNEEGHCEVL